MHKQAHTRRKKRRIYFTQSTIPCVYTSSNAKHAKYLHCSVARSPLIVHPPKEYTHSMLLANAAAATARIYTIQTQWTCIGGTHIVSYRRLVFLTSFYRYSACTRSVSCLSSTYAMPKQQLVFVVLLSSLSLPSRFAFEYLPTIFQISDCLWIRIDVVNVCMG